MIANLEGRFVMVTGGGAGIGRGIAAVLAAQGARVAVGDIDVENARAVADELGRESLALELDVRSDASVAAAFDRMLEAWGRIDILVNNAGIASATRGLEGAPDRDLDWEVVLDVNLRGTVRCSARASGSMKDQRAGKIVNIGSMAGHGARKVGGAYAVSKAAVLRYTRGLAIELAPFDVNVNAVCPGAVWTPLQQRGTAQRQTVNETFAGRDPYEVFVEAYAPTIPLARPQTPEDVGKAVAFLASDDAANITGQCLHVDGGAILRD